MAGRYPGEPLAPDLEPARRESVDLGLQTRALDLVRDGASVPADLVALQPPAATRDVQAVGGDLQVPGAGARSVRVHHGALVRLVGRLVVAEPHVAVRPEDLRRPELRRQLLQ